MVAVQSGMHTRVDQGENFAEAGGEGNFRISD